MWKERIDCCLEGSIKGNVQRTHPSTQIVCLRLCPHKLFPGNKSTPPVHWISSLSYEISMYAMCRFPSCLCGDGSEAREVMQLLNPRRILVQCHMMDKMSTYLGTAEMQKDMIKQSNTHCWADACPCFCVKGAGHKRLLCVRCYGLLFSFRYQSKDVGKILRQVRPASCMLEGY